MEYSCYVFPFETGHLNKGFCYEHLEHLIIPPNNGGRRNRVDWGKYPSFLSVYLVIVLLISSSYTLPCQILWLGLCIRFTFPRSASALLLLCLKGTIRVPWSASWLCPYCWQCYWLVILMPALVGVGCRHQWKMSFLHEREYFACSDYGTAPSPTISTLFRNKVLCDECNSMIVFIFKDVHWNLTHWKLEAYTCRELACLWLLLC